MRDPAERPAPDAFRVTLIKVLSVQAVTLLLLWLLQSVYQP